MKHYILAISFISLLLAGCQSGHQTKKVAVGDGNFMDLWKIYSHCRNTTDFEELKQDAIVLGTAAKHSSSGNGSVLSLFTKLQRLETAPSPRLAVDLKAMSASCSLRAGQAALDARKFDVTRELLQHILDYHPKAVYAFYSSQARAMLEEIKLATVQVSSLKHP